MKEQLIEARRVKPIIEHRPFVPKQHINMVELTRQEQAMLVAIRAELNKPNYNVVINLQNENPEAVSQPEKQPQTIDEAIAQFLVAMFSLGKGVFKSLVHGAAAAYRHT